MALPHPQAPGVRSGPGGSHPGFPRAWVELHREVARCTRCSLHESRTQVVFYRGGPKPRVLFVGEAPGAAEDREGVPFVGRSGRRLDLGIASLGLGPDAFGILNLIKCRPPGNRFDRGAAETCRTYLDRQIALLDPDVLVPLGAHALQALLPDAPRVTEASGHAIRRGSRLYFPLLHPAAPLHRPSLRGRWDHDLEALRTALGAIVPTGPRTHRTDPG